MTQDDLAKCREVAQFWREFHARNRIWSGAVTAQVIEDLCAEVERLTASAEQVAKLAARDAAVKP